MHWVVHNDQNLYCEFSQTPKLYGCVICMAMLPITCTRHTLKLLYTRYTLCRSTCILALVMTAAYYLLRCLDALSWESLLWEFDMREGCSHCWTLVLILTLCQFLWPLPLMLWWVPLLWHFMDFRVAFGLGKYRYLIMSCRHWGDCLI